MPDFMKVTGATTLGELALLRGQFGIKRITIDVDLEIQQPVIVTVWAVDHQTFGRGDTEAEALDDALARIQHRIGAITYRGVA